MSSCPSVKLSLCVVNLSVRNFDRCYLINVGCFDKDEIFKKLFETYEAVTNNFKNFPMYHDVSKWGTFWSTCFLEKFV